MIGEKLGPFQIQDKLGSGAMGVVYRALWAETGHMVAVKVVLSDSAMKSNSPDRFQRENDILKQFRHPNIVRHIGFGHSKARNLSYYAMEYVPGRTLDQELEERGALPWQEVVTLGIQICEALQYAHERGVVHRDLKPSNLLIHDETGKIKLTDFGIAKDLDRTALTATGRTLGTAAYMAPEQIRGTPEVSHKTDLYALGCVLYQMVTGALPFEGRTTLVLMHKHLEEPTPRPSAKQPDIPLALDKLIVGLMAKNRDDRPWDAAAAAHALTQLRDKIERKEEIRKVFGPPVAENPTRAPAPAPSPPAAAPTEGGTRARKKTRARRAVVEEPSIPQVRQWLEVGLLVLALVAASGLLAYVLWPPSAAYLYRKAKEGMAGESREDWIHARHDYIAELERRFPDHPYKQDVRDWLDRIALDDARRRANYLENPNALTEPRDDAERAYVRTFRAAYRDVERGLDHEALAKWRALADALESDDEHRGLFLLARQRAGELEAAMAGRLEAVTAALLQAEVAQRAGRAAEAARLRADILAEYGKFHHLDDLLAPIRPASDGTAPPADERDEP